MSNEEKVKSDRKLWEAWIMKYKEALSKMDQKVTDEERKASMNAVNPKFILRNYLMEEAIQFAEKQDFSKVD